MLACILVVGGSFGLFVKRVDFCQCTLVEVTYLLAGCGSLACKILHRCQCRIQRLQLHLLVVTVGNAGHSVVSSVGLRSNNLQWRICMCHRHCKFVSVIEVEQLACLCIVEFEAKRTLCTGSLFDGDGVKRPCIVVALRLHALVNVVAPLAETTHLTNGILVVEVNSVTLDAVFALRWLYAILNKHEVTKLLLIPLHTRTACIGLLFTEAHDICTVVANNLLVHGLKETPCLKELAQVHLCNFAALLGEFQLVLCCRCVVCPIAVLVAFAQSVVAQSLEQAWVECRILFGCVEIEIELKEHSRLANDIAAQRECNLLAVIIAAGCNSNTACCSLSYIVNHGI